MWLGATDILIAGEYIWESNGQQVTYTNWGGFPGLPDDNLGPQSENCMHMWFDIGQWNDLGCDIKAPAQATMCELIISCT